MSKFKVGDKVKRTKDFGSHFIRDKVYTVTAARNVDGQEYIALKEVSGYEAVWFEDYFELVKKGSGRLVKVDKHIVIQEDCDNLVGRYNSFKDAAAKIPETNQTHLIYKLTLVAKVENAPKITKITVKKTQIKKKK